MLFTRCFLGSIVFAASLSCLTAAQAAPVGAWAEQCPKIASPDKQEKLAGVSALIDLLHGDVASVAAAALYCEKSISVRRATEEVIGNVARINHLEAGSFAFLHSGEINSLRMKNIALRSTRAKELREARAELRTVQERQAQHVDGT